MARPCSTLEGVPKTPLAILKPPKPIGSMTAAELEAFADQLFGAIATTRRPA